MIRFLLVALLCVCAYAENPGAVVTIDETGLVKAKDFFLPKIISELRKITIPGEKGHDFEFGDIKIDSVGVESVDLILAPPDKLNVKITGLEISIAHTYFKIFKKIIITLHCSGHFWASISGTNIDLVIPFTDVKGKPHIPDITANVHFGNVHIDHKMDHLFCKILDKLASLFVNINKKLEELVKKKVPELLTTTLKKDANKALEKLATVVKIDKWAELDYELTGNPVVSSTALSLLSRGQFLNPNSPKPSKLVPPKMPAPPRRDAVFQMSPYVLNTASQVFTEQGRLDVRNKSLPITTSVFKLLFPKVYKDCPNCPLSVSLGVRKAPLANFKPHDGQLTADEADMELNVVHPGGKLQGLFTLEVNASMALNFSVKAQQGVAFVSATISLKQFTAAEVNSTIGHLPIKSLTALIDKVLTGTLIPYINSFLINIPVPSIPDVKLLNPILSVEQNAVVVASDIKFGVDETYTAEDIPGLKWVNATHGQPVPTNSVVGGEWISKDGKKHDYYICRGAEKKKHEVVPGKAGYYKAIWTCCWADGAYEHCEDIPHYQMLTSTVPLKWVQGTVGQPLPTGAVVGGHFPEKHSSHPYYVCRAHDHKRNQTVPGKLGYYYALWSCCWSNGGAEKCLYVPDYEVLTAPSSYHLGSTSVTGEGSNGKITLL